MVVAFDMLVSFCGLKAGLRHGCKVAGLEEKANVFCLFFRGISRISRIRPGICCLKAEGFIVQFEKMSQLPKVVVLRNAGSFFPEANKRSCHADLVGDFKLCEVEVVPRGKEGCAKSCHEGQ